ncbi:MAG: GTP-binding protein [Promethearchaeota archaeon]|nr:MAG: GTP-binding protein [Candidatus Lokiarchaeota archaeon]
MSLGRQCSQMRLISNGGTPIFHLGFFMVSDFIFKIIAAGEGGVGKTTLLNKYVEGKFDISTTMTIGVNIMNKQLVIDDKIEVNLQLWDFGGQERFRFFLDSCVVGARGALLLFDLTSITSFNKISDWVPILRKYNPELPILLVGAKADLDYKISVEDKYALQELENYKFIDYIKVSSKTGLNVEQTFRRITYELMGEAGKEFLATMKKKYDFFSTSLL